MSDLTLEFEMVDKDTGFFAMNSNALPRVVVSGDGGAIVRVDYVILDLARRKYVTVIPESLLDCDVLVVTATMPGALPYFRTIMDPGGKRMNHAYEQFKQAAICQQEMARRQQAHQQVFGQALQGTAQNPFMASGLPNLMPPGGMPATLSARMDANDILAGMSGERPGYLDVKRTGPKTVTGTTPDGARGYVYQRGPLTEIQLLDKRIAAVRVRLF